MPPSLPFVTSEPDPQTLVIAITGAAEVNFVWMFLFSVAATLVMGGPAMGAMAVVVNLRKVVPPPASSLGCMALGLTFAGLACAALMFGLGTMARSSALDRSPGTLTLVRQGSGVTVDRRFADGSVAWSGTLADTDGLAVKVEDYSTKSGRVYEARLVKDGRPVGPDRGVLLGRGMDVEAFDKASAAANEGLAAWVKAGR